MGELEERRKYSAARLGELLSLIRETQKLCKGRACVYAIGSYGRGEAGPHSDLDVYIVGRDDQEFERSLLRPLDEICVKADLISAIRKLQLPEFDGEGKYLAHYPIKHLIKAIGTTEDDASNMLTARLLLLLEGKPLVEKDVYQQAITEIIAAYWRDYQDHKDNFVPAYLINDVLRLWRTFCVNYEARTKSQPDDKKAKRKIKNYKLKHSRILTCYSALLYLLAIYGRNNTVAPDDAVQMSLMSPTERLEWLLKQDDLKDASTPIFSLIEHYEYFLKVTNVPEEELIAKVINRTIEKDFFAKAYGFGETMFEAISAIGKGSKLHRLIVV